MPRSRRGRWLLAMGLALMPALTTAGPANMPERRSSLRFADLPGWAADDHAAAFAAFRRSCEAIVASAPEARPGVPPSEALVAVCRTALTVPETPDRTIARAFFERWFRPVRLGGGPGLMTGYYEPEMPGHVERTPRYQAPLLARPDDLVSFLPTDPVPDHLSGLAAARRRDDGTLEPYFDRAAIEEGALAGKGLELVYLEKPFDAFIVQVQGSARVRLEDGRVLRVAYAGRNGHPYSSIGRELIAQGVLTRDTASLQRIRAVFEADPDLARRTMRTNKSFVFFRLLEDHDPRLGPIGAQGLPLTPGRSIAVDRTIHAYGTPFYVVGHPATGGPSRPPRGLMIAQDTGTAIVGLRRIDVFTGWGDAAEALAGTLRNPLDLYALQPVAEAQP